MGYILLIVQVFFALLFFAIILYLLYSLYAMVSGAPFVPTNKKDVETMIRLAQLSKDDTIIDLGFGEGRIVFASANRCRYATGIEINPLLYWKSLWTKKLKRIKNTTFIRNSFWNIDLGKYDVIFLYLIPHRMKKLEKKIKAEMKPGSRIISHAFRFPDWQHDEKCDNIYRYNV